MSLTEAIFARPSFSQMERLIAAEEVKNRIMSTYVGTPLVASTAAGMTDTDRIYVYVGSETGYTSGNWYYYDGSAWTSGGVYNSTAFETDDTLTIPDAAADSKAVGDELSDLKNAITQLNTVKPINYLWHKFEKPSAFTPTIPFDIYTDNYNYKTSFDFDNFKNSGGATYYVKANGTSGPDGLTRETAINFQAAYNRSVNGDTIILLEDDYDRDSLNWNYTTIQKNINIIGEGKCRIFAGQLKMTFTQTQNYSHVYQTTRNSAKHIIDYKTLDNEYILYTLKTSIADVETTEGSYYIDGSTVYVHAYGNGNPSDIVCVSVSEEDWLNANNENQDTTVVYQNIELIGKFAGVLFNKTNTSNSLTVICDNVRLYYCGNSTNDSFMVYGGTAIFNNCKAVGSFKDGFNYNGVNKSNVSTDTLCIEINCIGSSCGLLQSGEYQNGSTAHAGAKVVRINGIYFDNFGANVADVQADTMSLNLGCKAFNSSASQVVSNFSAQQEGATMWLYGCVAAGATSDITCATNAVMNLAYCTFIIKSGAGTINEQNTLPFDIYTLYKTSEIG